MKDLDVPCRWLLDEASVLWAFHRQPEDVPVCCHVLHVAFVEDLSLFVDLNVLANEQRPIVFRLPHGEVTRRGSVLGMTAGGGVHEDSW